MLTRRDDVITDDKTTLAQRHRGGAAVRTSTAHPTLETAGRVLPNRRTAGSRLPTELQTTAGEDGCRTPADYPRNFRRLLGRMAAVHQQTTHGTADDCWGGWLPYTSSWIGNSDLGQSYGGSQAREVHPLDQLPPYAPASYGWGGQDYPRYIDWGDEDFRHRGSTNGRTQSIEYAQDHKHS